MALHYFPKVWLAGFIQTISRIHGSIYTVNFERIQNPDITGSFVQNLEEAIIKQPEAWLWSHKRWKHKNRRHSMNRPL